MYLLIGILVSLHLLAAMMNWNSWEKSPRGSKSVAIPIVTGVIFGFFSVAAYNFRDNK